jgi:integrase
MEYWIKKPGGTRKRFAIVERESRQGKAKQVKDARIDSINQQFVAGTLTLEEAHALIHRIKSEYQSKLKQHSNFNDANLVLFSRYWDARYSRRKIDPDSVRSARNNYQRAIKAVGALSLAGSSIEEIQRALDRLTNSRQRRAAGCINRLLAFCGRVERVESVRKQRVKISYLNPIEFNSMLQHVPSPLRLPVQVAFYTGMRVGEVFGDNHFNDLNQSVMVTWQSDDALEEKDTKTGEVRDAVVLGAGIEIVKEWLSIPLTKRLELRAKRWSDIVGRACVLAGLAPRTFHDLRHSYAIELLTRGAPLELVSLSLGNSVSVCQEYYVGFVLTSAMAQALKRYAG